MSDRYCVTPQDDSRIFHGRTCTLQSREYRIEQVVARICEAETPAQARAWLRALRQAQAQLSARVDERIAELEAREAAGQTAEGGGES